MAAPEAANNRNLDIKNHDDATTFASSLMEQVNREDIASMVYIQRDMLSRFEKTNEMLINFNILSASRYEATVKDFQKHTQLLYDMKKDLDVIFKRIRLLKQRLEKNYPEAFAECSSVYAVSDSEEDDDDDDDENDSDEPEHRTFQTVDNSQSSSTKNETPSSSTTLTHDPPLVILSDVGSPTSPGTTK